MKENEEDMSSEISNEKTNTSSYNDDTYFQEVNNPLFPKMRPRVGVSRPLSNKNQPGVGTVYVSSSKLKEGTHKKHNFEKLLFFGKHKKKESNNGNNNININDINNNINDKAHETKKLKKNKKMLNKMKTINFFSPANEFQQTALDKNNIIEDNILDEDLGLTLKPLEEQWKYQKILLDYNILDFTSKK